MEKVFKERKLKKIKLSEYLKKPDRAFEHLLCDEGYRERRTKYIIDSIGDVELDKKEYALFIAQFQHFGRYDVNVKRDTYKEMYKISQMYPFLSADSLETIWGYYIKDLFEEYALDEMLGEFFKSYGQTEEAFYAYIDFVEEKATEIDKKFEEESKGLEEYQEEYGEDLIRTLQGIMRRHHVHIDQIKSSLPSYDLIEKDKKQLIEISRQTRIYFGCCQPISYQMIESLATGSGLDYYPEQPAYLINESRKIETTFTKQEFLDSIKKRLEDAEEPKEKQKK